MSVIIAPWKFIIPALLKAVIFHTVFRHSATLAFNYISNIKLLSLPSSKSSFSQGRAFAICAPTNRYNFLYPCRCVTTNLYYIYSQWCDLGPDAFLCIHFVDMVLEAIPLFKYNTFSTEMSDTTEDISKTR